MHKGGAHSNNLKLPPPENYKVVYTITWVVLQQGVLAHAHMPSHHTSKNHAGAESKHCMNQSLSCAMLVNPNLLETVVCKRAHLANV